jgi:hypothetical protein
LRTRSSASFSKYSLKSANYKEIKSEETSKNINNNNNNNSNKAVVSISSSSSIASSNHSLNSSPSLNSKSRLVNKEAIRKNNNSNLKIENLILSDAKKQQVKGEYECLINNSSGRLDDDDLELEAIKEILIKYNLPINKRIVKSLKNYIGQYGGIEKFQNSLISEIERNKFNSFVAAASAAYIAKAKTNSSPLHGVPNSYVETCSSILILKLISFIFFNFDK